MAASAAAAAPLVLAEPETHRKVAAFKLCALLRAAAARPGAD